MEYNAFSLHSTEERILGTLLASGLTFLVPISSGSVPYCLQTDPAPTPHTCTQHAHSEGTHTSWSEPRLRRRKLKANASPNFSLYLLSLHGDILKDNLFLFSTQNRCPVGVWNQLQGELWDPEALASSGCCAGAPARPPAQGAGLTAGPEKPLLYPTSFCNKANPSILDFLYKKGYSALHAATQAQSSAEGKCRARWAAVGEHEHRPVLGAHTEPRLGAAWRSGRAARAGAGRWGSITHTDEASGAPPLEPNSLETTSVSHRPGETRGLTGSSPRDPSCADPGAGQALGRQGPTEGRHPHRLDSPVPCRSPRPACLPLSCQVLPAPASPFSGWEGALWTQVTGLSKKGL